MVLRRRAFDNRMVSAVVGMKTGLDMHRWNRLSEERRNLLGAQELLRLQGYESEMADCL